MIVTAWVMKPGMHQACSRKVLLFQSGAKTSDPPICHKNAAQESTKIVTNAPGLLQGVAVPGLGGMGPSILQQA